MYILLPSSSSELPSFLPPAPPPSYSSTVQPFNSTNSDGVGEVRHGPISAASLQQALANVRPQGSPVRRGGGVSFDVSLSMFLTLFRSVEQ